MGAVEDLWWYARFRGFRSIHIPYDGMCLRDDLAAQTDTLFLCPFRARNPLTGKW